jgi:hypothetical protein
MPKSQYLICYNLSEAIENQILEHPNDVIASMGIHFKSSSYDPILGQWIFSDCSKAPKEIPSHISVFEWDD